MTNLSKLASASVVSMLVACGAATTGTDGGVGGGGASTGGGSGGGGSGGGGGTSTDAGIDAGAGYCPTVILPSTVPQTYNGDTTGKPDLIYDMLWEFGQNVPDDALSFTAPSAGTYRVKLLATPQTNGGCYLAWETAGPSTRAKCPTSPNAINYSTPGLKSLYTTQDAGSSTDWVLAANQEAMFFFGCTYWSTPQKFGTYQLSIEKL